jgi:CRISPR-associated endonuclease Csn1
MYTFIAKFSNKMTKKILGLDIGVSSVGLAVVEKTADKYKIIDMAVRVVPEDPNFHGKFYSGKTASKNEARTRYRQIRRGIQRFKLRRDALNRVLSQNNMMPDDTLIHLSAKELYGLRNKAISDKLSEKEIGRVFMHLNQRRGFLSSRKSNSEEENLTEYKERIKQLQNELGTKTIGQHLYDELCASNNGVDVLLRERTYLRASYVEEFDRIWDAQKKHHPALLSGGPQEDNNKGSLYDKIRNRILFYQRPLRSQKDLISSCTFEPNNRVAPKSSPYFEWFRIWQKLNDLEWKTPDGLRFKPSMEQKQALFNELFYNTSSDKAVLKITAIKNCLGFKKSDKIYLNFEELDGSRTYAMLRDALEQAEITDVHERLFFNPEVSDEQGGLMEWWHLTYSIPNEADLIRSLANRMHITKEQAKIITKKTAYKPDYGSLSTRAIKKLLPHLLNGLGYSEACDAVGYDHSGYKTKQELKEKLSLLMPNALRNPVVEQILNQMVNMVNLAIDEYGPFDEIRVELARELKNNAKKRNQIEKQQNSNKKKNEDITKELKNSYGFKVVSKKDIQRYTVWNETENQCLYCNNPISNTEFLNGLADIEHIIPRSRSFSDNINNFILAHRKCNRDKNQHTAYDFMEQKGENVLKEYIEKVNRLYDNGKGSISRLKFQNLLARGNEIPDDMVDRMKNDTQYISREAVKILKGICENVHTTTGQITDYLRMEWGLNDVLKELMIDTYRAANETEWKEIKDRSGNIIQKETIKNWTKRDDHRHHAVDALICALTDAKIIFKLNNLNKIYQYERDMLSPSEIKAMEDALSEETGEKTSFNLKQFISERSNTDAPIPNLREEAKKHLAGLFISFKKSSKVFSKNVNRPKKGLPQITWTPRSHLHEETVMRKVLTPGDKPVSLNKKFDIAWVDQIVNNKEREAVKQHLATFNNDPELAFDKKTLKQSPLEVNGKALEKVTLFEEVLSKRVPISTGITTAQMGKIADGQVKTLLEQRMNAYGNDPKKAFADISNNPIWLNRDKGIQIKSFRTLENAKAQKVREGYVQTKGNHHALIYCNNEGIYTDVVVSFWEAVNLGLTNIKEKGHPYPIIQREDHPEYGRLVFTMQINDLFVLDLKHSKNPKNDDEINFLDINNRELLSKKTFRLQKMSKKSNGAIDIVLRQQYETSINREIKEITLLNFQSISHFKRLTKIVVNALGQIRLDNTW